MTVSADYLTYLLDQLGSFARVRSRRMFGAVGLYADDLFFAIADDDCLFFKVDDSNRADYIQRDSEAFRPYANDPTRSMNYFSVPPDVLEDPDALKVWARRSMAAAAAVVVKKSIRIKSAPRATPPGRKPARRKKIITR